MGRRGVSGCAQRAIRKQRKQQKRERKKQFDRDVAHMVANESEIAAQDQEFLHQMEGMC
jgi:hypothetical protein